jgi:MFS family permease
MKSHLTDEHAVDQDPAPERTELLYRGSWLAFATLMLGHLSQGLTFTAFAPALPQLARDFGGGSQGMLIAELTLMISALGMMVGALASGWIVDRLGAPPVLLGSLLIYGLLGSGGLYLHSPALLLASRFGVGFVCACMVTTCISLIATDYSGQARARVLGISGAMASLISLVAMLVGGTLARYGGWRLAFVQYPVFASAGLLIVLGAPRLETPVRTATTWRGSSFMRRLWPLYAVTVILAGVMFMGSAQFPFMLEQDGVRDPSMRSVIMSTVTLTAVLVSLLYGALQRYVGQLGALACGALSMSLALLLVDLTSTPQLAAVAAALMGVFVGIVIPFLHHYVTEHSPIHDRSRAIGVLNAFNFLGGFLNPLAFAPLARYWGLRTVFLLVSVVMLIIAGGTLVVRLRAARTHVSTRMGSSPSQ